MRYFLGFDLDAKDKLAIETWRGKSLPEIPTHVPAKNFHVTSVFLGQVTSSQLDKLLSLVGSRSFDSFSIEFDLLGFWSKPKIVFLGANKANSQATLIANCLFDFAKQSGLMLPHRQYVPHITLTRKIAFNPPAPLIAPSFQCHFTQLSLFESVSTKHGVHYPIRQSWDLNTFRRPI